MSSDRFSVGTETAWDPPSRMQQLKTLIGGLLDAGHAANNANVDYSGDPRWRVVVREGELELAASEWSKDWAGVERRQADWTSRLDAMDDSEVATAANSWAREAPTDP